MDAAESDKRDLMKELDTTKQLKPHPHVIKLLGCVTESGELFLLFAFAVEKRVCSVVFQKGTKSRIQGKVSRLLRFEQKTPCNIVFGY